MATMKSTDKPHVGTTESRRAFEPCIEHESRMIAEVSALQCVLAVLDRLEDGLGADSDMPSGYLNLLGSAIHTMEQSLDRIESLMADTTFCQPRPQVIAEDAASADHAATLN